jgi:hypothetical protein
LEEKNLNVFSKKNKGRNQAAHPFWLTAVLFDYFKFHPPVFRFALFRVVRSDEFALSFSDADNPGRGDRFRDEDILDCICPFLGE